MSPIASIASAGGPIHTRPASRTRWANPAFIDTVAAFSVVTHFDGFQKGVIDSRDLFYFLSVIGFSLFATNVILRNR